VSTCTWLMEQEIVKKGCAAGETVEVLAEACGSDQNGGEECIDGWLSMVAQSVDGCQPLLSLTAFVRKKIKGRKAAAKSNARASKERAQAGRQAGGRAGIVCGRVCGVRKRASGRACVCAGWSN
jgi:hypothetical protein